nr:MAG TPA: hypothetical protein [Caudoviricetes sp.]
MNDNILYEIGDVLLIDVMPKITGRVHLTDFSDVLEGVTSTRTVQKEFRVSPDGVFWNSWQPLTAENLSLSEYVVDGALTIQLRYTRTGSDSTGVIEFKSIDFMGSREAIQFVAPTISSSIFANIIGTPEMKALEENLFKKLYYRGLVPAYIPRADNSDENEDRDYIDLFFSVARFFSLFIRFFKRFENFGTDFDLMREQVRQYGIYFDESNITLEELQYLAQHLYDQIRQRGTEMIFKRKGYLMPNGETLQIDGEFIRLLRSKTTDELLYENMPLSRVGWCLGQSSPMYRGTSQAYYLNKTPENSSDFQNLDNFLINKTNERSTASIVETDDGKKVLSFNILNDSKIGIGNLNENAEIPDKYFVVVDSKLDYEITFAIKILDGANDKNTITFGVDGYDVLKNKLSDAFITPNGDKLTDVFFEISEAKFKNEVWYFVRGILFSYSSSNLEESLTNIGFGSNLYFNNSFVKYIIPKIIINGVYETEIQIWDYKIRPLVRGTNILPLKNGEENSHSLGFIQSSRIFYSYVRNNNNSQSKDEITDIIEKYLLPYNVTDIFVFMSNY